MEKSVGYDTFTGNVGGLDALPSTDHPVYGHPLYIAAREAQTTMAVARKLLTDALKAIPETPARQVAIMHMQTTSMWLEQAHQEGMRALETALRKQADEVAAAEKQACAAAEDRNARAGLPIRQDQ